MPYSYPQYSFDSLDLSCEDLCVTAYTYTPEQFFAFLKGQWVEIGQWTYFFLGFARNVKLLKVDAKFRRV